MFRPPSSGRVPAEPGPVRVQLVMVRLVNSQWLLDATLGSELLKLTSQDTALVAWTVKVELFVVSVLSAADVAFVSVFEYSCPPTGEPDVAPQLSPVNNWVDSVPFSGAPWAAATVAVSLGSQVCCEAADVVSLTTTFSVVSEQLPLNVEPMLFGSPVAGV